MPSTALLEFGFEFQNNRCWRRARLPFWSIDSQNHDHRAAAFGTLPKAFCVFRLSFVCGCLRIRSERPEAKRQKTAPVPTCKKAEIANAYKALWKQMKQKAAQKLLCG